LSPPFDLADVVEELCVCHIAIHIMVNLNAAAWKDVSRSTGERGNLPFHARTWEATIHMQLFEQIVMRVVLQKVTNLVSSFIPPAVTGDEAKAVLKGHTSMHAVLIAKLVRAWAVLPWLEMCQISSFAQGALCKLEMIG
jgi:hypothetical protein